MTSLSRTCRSGGRTLAREWLRSFAWSAFVLFSSYYFPLTMYCFIALPVYWVLGDHETVVVLWVRTMIYGVSMYLVACGTEWVFKRKP